MYHVIYHEGLTKLDGPTGLETLRSQTPMGVAAIVIHMNRRTGRYQPSNPNSRRTRDKPPLRTPVSPLYNLLSSHKRHRLRQSIWALPPHKLGHWESSP